MLTEAPLFARESEVRATLDALVSGAKLVTVWGPRGVGTSAVAHAARALHPDVSTIMIERAQDLSSLDLAELRSRVGSTAGLYLATSTQPLEWPGARSVEVAPLRPDTAEALWTTLHGPTSEVFEAEAFGGLPKLIEAGGEPRLSAAVAAMYEDLWASLDGPSREAVACACVFAGPIDTEQLVALLEDDSPVEARSLVASLRALGVAAPFYFEGSQRLALLSPFRRFVSLRTPSRARDEHRERFIEILAAAVSKLFESARENSNARARLRLQRDNILAAIAYATERHDPRHLPVLVSAFHDLRLLDGIDRTVLPCISPWLDRGRFEVREAALRAQAMIERFQGNHAAARSTLAGVLTAMRERGTHPDLLRIEQEIAKLDLACGRSGEAELGFARMLSAAEGSIPDLHAEAVALRAIATSTLGDAAGAVPDLQRSIARFADIGDEDAAALHTLSLARARAELGQYRVALDLIDAVMRDAEAWHLERIAVGRGLAARLLALLYAEGACAMASLAREAARTLGRADLAWQCECVCAEVALLEGRPVDMSIWAPLLEEQRRLDIGGQLSIHLERLGAAASVISGEFLTDHQDVWIDRLVRIQRGDGPTVEAELAAERAQGEGLDASIARRLTEQLLAKRSASSLRLASRIGRNGSWFERPGRARVDLSSHPSLARFLCALVEKREASVLSMFQSTWPQQDVEEPIARKRVQVVASRLRKLGLEDLSFRGDTYGLPANAWWIFDLFEEHP